MGVIVGGEAVSMLQNWSYSARNNEHPNSKAVDDAIPRSFPNITRQREAGFLTLPFELLHPDLHCFWELRHRAVRGQAVLLAASLAEDGGGRPTSESLLRQFAKIPDALLKRFARFGIATR